MKHLLTCILAIFSMSTLVGCSGEDGSESSSASEVDSDFQGVNGSLQGKIVYEVSGDLHSLDLASGSDSILAEFRKDPYVSMDGSEIVSLKEYYAYDPALIALSKSDGQKISSFEVYRGTKWPKFSPDNQSIAAIRRGEVTLYSRDGEVLKSLPDDITAYDWMPDGRLVYASGGIIYQTNTDLNEPTQIGEAFSYHPSHLSVSPDGSQITFGMYGPPPSSSEENMMHTWIMNMDGSGLKQLADSSDGYGEYQTAWSPDGRWVLVRQKIRGDGDWDQGFIYTDENLFAVPADAENVDLTLINLDRLEPPLESDIYDQDPPDSPAIAIQKYHDGEFLVPAKAGKSTLNWVP